MGKSCELPCLWGDPNLGECCVSKSPDELIVVNGNRNIAPQLLEDHHVLAQDIYRDQIPTGARVASKATPLRPSVLACKPIEGARGNLPAAAKSQLLKCDAAQLSYALRLKSEQII